MLGDLDRDGRWSASDRKLLDGALREPFAVPADTACRIDLNRNSLIDPEDVSILEALIAAGGDPYAAEGAARDRGTPFPRPRELYRYVPLDRVPVATALRDAGAPGGRLCDRMARKHSSSNRGGFLCREPRPRALLRGDPVRSRLASPREGARFRSSAIRGVRSWLRAREHSSSGRAVRAAPRADGAGRGRGDAHGAGPAGGSRSKLLAFRDHLREVLALARSTPSSRPGSRTGARCSVAFPRTSSRTSGSSYDFETLGPPRNHHAPRRTTSIAPSGSTTRARPARTTSARSSATRSTTRGTCAPSREPAGSSGTRRREPQPADGASLPRGAAHQGRRQEEGGRPARRVDPHPVRLDQVDPARGAARLARARQLPAAREQGGRRRQEPALERFRRDLSLQVARRKRSTSRSSARCRTCGTTATPRRRCGSSSGT